MLRIVIKCAQIFLSKMNLFHWSVNPWLVTVGAAMVIAGALSFAPTGLAEDVACGLGLPPGAPGFAQEKAQRAAEENRNGFRRVCEANLDRYSVTFMPMVTATAGLDFTPVDLGKTPFAPLKALGGRQEKISDTASRLYRGFKIPSGQTLTLFEHDMSADGGRVWRDPKDEPELVNGLPAKLVVMEASSGRAISVLSWIQGRRYYEIWLEANAARNPLRATLFSYASSLPPPIPACPNEQLPGKAGLGPDGFPLDEPMPSTLTEEQINAIGKKRSCN